MDKSNTVLFVYVFYVFGLAIDEVFSMRLFHLRGCREI